MRRVLWHPVRVALRRPLVAAGGALRERRALVVRLETADGVTGCGEVTPWPAFGLGDADSAAAQLPRLAGRLSGRTLEDALAELDAAEWEPAVRCGVELALLDAAGRTAGLPVAAWLGEGRAPVRCNALIGSGAPDDVVAQARAAVAAGYGTLKLKVAAAPLQREREIVGAVRAAVGSDVALRLDANGAWSEAEAAAALTAFEPFGIEFVEQPVAAAPLDALARVRARAPMPIAADEAAHDARSVRRLIADRGADVLVLKPMAAGGVRAAAGLARAARAAGMEVVVTTTIDLGIATAGALHLAAALAPRYASGLATAALLEADLTGGEPAVVGGTMALPDAPGLGVSA